MDGKGSGEGTLLVCKAKLRVGLWTKLEQRHQAGGYGLADAVLLVSTPCLLSALTSLSLLLYSPESKHAPARHRPYTGVSQMDAHRSESFPSAALVDTAGSMPQ